MEEEGRSTGWSSVGDRSRRSRRGAIHSSSAESRGSAPLRSYQGERALRFEVLRTLLRVASARGRSSTLEHGLALLDEGARRLAMVLGEAGMHVVCRLETQTLLEARARRAVEVLLHVAVRDGRSRGEPARQSRGLGGEGVIGHDAIHEAEPL